VAGSHITQGYWNRLEDSTGVVQARLADTGKGPVLRTGGLGFQSDGSLYLTGRLQDSLIVRGAKHDPEDMKAAVEQSHTALRSYAGAVFALNTAEDISLVVAQEVVRDYQQSGLNEAIAAARCAAGQEQDLQVHAVLLLRAGSLPRTSSGKVRRHACATG
jgi:acyl-CoA synthetase (AMP-forming)/AMP-acid ligase II